MSKYEPIVTWEIYNKNNHRVEEIVISELEKIRSEIQEEIFNSKGYVTYTNALMRCYEIVDNHISELKGINND